MERQLYGAVMNGISFKSRLMWSKSFIVVVLYASARVMCFHVAAVLAVAHSLLVRVVSAVAALFRDCPRNLVVHPPSGGEV